MTNTLRWKRIHFCFWRAGLFAINMSTEADQAESMFHLSYGNGSMPEAMVDLGRFDTLAEARTAAERCNVKKMERRTA